MRLRHSVLLVFVGIVAFLLEPNSGIRRLAERQRRRTTLGIEYLDLPGERIPLDEGSVDTVVSTFTLCTIPGVVEALRGVVRVLRQVGSSFSLNTVARPSLPFGAGRGS
jgi:ubiquinone/menaquinone biosynthesis C-methylase UbiE